MRRGVMVLVAVFVVVGGMVTPATAITYSFEGVLTRVDAYDLPDPTMPLQVGDTFTGTFSYGYLAPPTAPRPGLYPANPASGFFIDYCLTLEGTDLQVGGGTTFLLVGDTGLSLNDLHPTSSEEVRYYGLLPSDLFLAFAMESGTFPGSSLPETFDPSCFLSGSMGFDAFANETANALFVRGDITSLTAVPTPEPATLLLLGAGLSGAAALGRRRRTHNRRPL